MHWKEKFSNHKKTFYLQYVVFDLFVAGDNKIDVEHTYENVMEAIVAHPSINKVLFGSRQIKIEPVKIKKFNLLMIDSSIIKLKYREKMIK